MAERSLLVLGLGNVLCGDDGLGIVAAERLERRFRLPPEVRVMDGGTLGLSLMGLVREADDLLLLDAVRADAPAGTLVRLSGDEVGPAVRDRLSVHQIGVCDFLDGLRWLGAEPERLCLLGLVPASLGWGPGLSAPVLAGLDELVSAAAELATTWGYPLEPSDAMESEGLPAAGGVVARVLGL